MRKPLILLALTLTAFIISVEILIVNVALPALMQELGASTAELQWVVDAYSLAFAALVLAGGSIGDRQGRKGVLLAGLVIFGASCLWAAFIDTPGPLIAARALMGMGAALMFPATLSILVNVFTERAERAGAIGMWGTVTGFGVATGPIVGGWLLAHHWWGSIFVFMAVVAVVVGALICWVVPTSRDPRTPPVDWLGLLLSSAGVAVLVLGVIEAPGWGWESVRTASCLVLGVALLVVFVAVEYRVTHPMLDVSLFANPRFSAASGAVAISFFALQGFIFVITQYLQLVKFYSPFSMGVRLLPMAFAVALSSLTGTKLAVKIGNKVIVASGLVLFATGLLWTSRNTGTTTYGMIAGEMLLLGVGVGLASAPATEAIMGAVSEEKAGVGAAVNDATRLFGGTLGVAVIGSVASSLYRSRLESALPADPAGEKAYSAASKSFGAALQVSQTLAGRGLAESGHRLFDAATTAFLHSMSGASLVAAGVSLVGALLAALLLPARPRSGAHDAPTHLLARDMSGAAAGALMADALLSRRRDRSRPQDGAAPRTDGGLSADGRRQRDDVP
jgi:EmrB/QacA subfamily drug resistance transporter